MLMPPDQVVEAIKKQLSRRGCGTYNLVFGVIIGDEKTAVLWTGQEIDEYATNSKLDILIDRQLDHVLPPAVQPSYTSQHGIE